jgi:hypothetical protein
VRLNSPSIREQFAGVLEQHHAVAEPAPALRYVADHDLGGGVTGRVRRRTPRLMLAHGTGPHFVATGC